MTDFKRDSQTEFVNMREKPYCVIVRCPDEDGELYTRSFAIMAANAEMAGWMVSERLSKTENLFRIDHVHEWSGASFNPIED